MRSRYFSFFGSLLIPCGNEKGLEEARKAMEAFQAIFLSRYYEYLDEEYSSQVADEKATSEALEHAVVPACSEVVDLGADGCVRAEGYVFGRVAILHVHCDAAGFEWSELGLVRWPLEFEGPAAVAGSCCAPRYGLER